MPIRHQRYLRDRFNAIGVSKNLASSLSLEVSRWVEESGPLWTVNRLKLLKTAFLRRIAGETYRLPYVASRKDALGAVPKGPFGVLWKVNVSDMTSISRALNAMMVYSAFTAEDVTPGQWDKFHSSMQRPSPNPPGLSAVLSSLFIPKWMRVDSRRELTKVEEFVVKSGYSSDYFNKALHSFVEEGDTGMALWEEFPQYKECLSSLSGPIQSRFNFDDYFGCHAPLNSETTWAPIGKLGFTQEPGYKLRVFANPNIIHQMVMSRLKAQLFHLLRGVKWDCTFNQENGTSWVQEQLNQGKKVWSIDLSDATNNFPLDIQLSVLRSIGCRQEDVNLFHRLSRAPWSSSHGDSSTLRWTVGQPLGLGPSFAAFALTHGVLVNSLAQQDSVIDGFRVLGDDIVISEEKLATKYLEAMQRLGIPISADKTISSTKFAEFAGKVVTKDGILAALKWREPSDRSFLDVVRLLGPQSLGLLRKRQKKVATFISVLPEPRGFGWNPKGIPFEQRLRISEEFAALTTESTRTYYPLEKQWNKVRLRLELPYLKPSFTAVHVDSYVGTTSAQASSKQGREPTPVGSGMHLLSISEMTGTPLRLPDSEVTPYLEKHLRARGYVTLTSTTDPRGINLLEGLESKITTLQHRWTEQGLNSFVS